MDFGAYNDASVTLMVELVNSYDVCCDPPEKLDGVPALETLLRTHWVLRDERATERDLRELRELRGRVREVVEASNESEQLTLLNAVLADAGARPRVVSRDGELVLDFAPDAAPLAPRVAAEVGMGLAMMLVDHADRLKVCASAPCRDVFVDQSKNRCRRYCGDTCGSRSTVAAYRQRQRESATA